MNWKTLQDQKIIRQNQRTKGKRNVKLNKQLLYDTNESFKETHAFQRRFSLRQGSPIRERGQQFKSQEKLRPASSLAIRKPRFSRPGSPRDISHYSSFLNGQTTKSVIDFQKQIPREPFIDPRKGPHERRFQTIKTPTVLSSYHTPKPPDFQKTQGRANNILLQKKEMYLIDYDVNINSVAKSLGKGVPAFQKFVKRQDPAIKKAFYVPECYPLRDIQRGEKQLSSFVEAKLIPMNKQLSRDNRMYNINQGNNLKPIKDTLSSGQKIDSALSLLDSQENRLPQYRPYSRSKRVTRPGTSSSFIERRSSKRRNSLSMKKKSATPARKQSDLTPGGSIISDYQFSIGTNRRLKMSEIIL